MFVFHILNLYFTLVSTSTPNPTSLSIYTLMFPRNPPWSSLHLPSCVGCWKVGGEQEWICDACNSQSCGSQSWGIQYSTAVISHPIPQARGSPPSPDTQRAWPPTQPASPPTSGSSSSSTLMRPSWMRPATTSWCRPPRVSTSRSG